MGIGRGCWRAALRLMAKRLTGLQEGQQFDLAARTCRGPLRLGKVTSPGVRVGRSLTFFWPCCDEARRGAPSPDFGSGVSVSWSLLDKLAWREWNKHLTKRAWS